MSLKDDLDSLNIAAQDKVGRVMSSGAVIVGLRDRASQYVTASNADVVSQAQAVVAKANGLLDNYKSIDTDAVAVLGQASSMSTAMNTDPIWQTVLSGDLSNMGWASLQKIQEYTAQGSNLLSALNTLNSRADAHLGSVDDLTSDVSSLDSFAQGKGLKAAIAGIRSVGTDYLSTLKWVGIGAIALFFLPELFAAGKLLKPRVYSNPRRRRARR